MGSMLPQDMASWNIVYFKLKKFEDVAEQEGHSAFLCPLLFFPVTHHNIPMGEAPSHPFLQRHRDSKKNPDKQALLSAVQFITFSSYSLNCLIPPQLYTLHGT